MPEIVAEYVENATVGRVVDTRRDRQPRHVPRVRRSRLHDRRPAPDRRRRRHDALSRRAGTRPASHAGSPLPLHATPTRPSRRTRSEVAGVRLTVHRGAGRVPRGSCDRRSHSPDGRASVELWLGSDPGFGPQSEPVFAAPGGGGAPCLGPTPVRVAALVAVPPHRARCPDGPGRGRSAASRRSPIPRLSSAVAQQFHGAARRGCTASTPRRSTSPSLGPTGLGARARARRACRQASALSTTAACGGVPAITLAFLALAAGTFAGHGDEACRPRARMPTGPGYFNSRLRRTAALISECRLCPPGRSPSRTPPRAHPRCADMLERFPDLAAPWPARRDRERSAHRAPRRSCNFSNTYESGATHTT